MNKPRGNMAFLLMGLSVLTGCNLWEESASNDRATVTMAWPAPSSERGKPGEAPKASLPAEISSIGIVLRDTEGRNLAVGELRREGPTLSLAIPAGLAVDLTAEARSGSEVLYRGKSSLGVLGVGEARNVRVPLEEIITLSLVSPQTAFGPGGDSGQLNLQVQGLQNTAVKWFVNDIEGGDETIGTITNAGVYKPPVTVTSNTTVTARAVPLVAPSFAQEVTLKLVKTSVSVRENAVSVSGNELDPDPTNNSVVETTTIVDAP